MEQSVMTNSNFVDERFVGKATASIQNSHEKGQLRLSFLNLLLG